MKHGVNWLVIFAFLLALGLRGYFALIAPLEPCQVTSKLTVYNDEPAHRSVIIYWLEHGRHPSRGVDPNKPLPIELGNIVARTGEDFQPPLYYLIGSLVFRLETVIGLSDPVVLLRFLSVLFGLITLYYMWLSIRLIGSPEESAAGLLFGAILLSQVRFTSLITNDALLWAISAAVFYLVLPRIRNSITAKQRVVLIVLLILGLWTKLSFFPLVLLLPVTWLLNLRSDQDTKFPVLELVIPLVCWIPWLVWNHNHWGSILPMAVGFGAPELPFTGVPRLIATLLYLFRSFWFPFDDIWGGGWRPVIFVVIGLAVLMILILSLLEIIRRIDLSRTFAQDSLQVRIIGISLLTFTLVLGSFLWLNLHYFQCEARLLFPAFTPIVIILIMGVRRLISPKVGPWILPGLAAFSYLVFIQLS